MAEQEVDYDALAEQARKAKPQVAPVAIAKPATKPSTTSDAPSSSIDYDALAAKARTSASHYPCNVPYYSLYVGRHSRISDRQSSQGTNLRDDRS